MTCAVHGTCSIRLRITATERAIARARGLAEGRPLEGLAAEGHVRDRDAAGQRLPADLRLGALGLVERFMAHLLTLGRRDVTGGSRAR